MPMTDAADIAARLGGLEGYGVPLLALTDEELQAIDPQALNSRVVVYPYLDELDDDQRHLATVVAFRGLAARDLVKGPDEAEVEAALAAASTPEASVAISVASDLHVILQVRRYATTVICAERTTENGHDFAYWWLPDNDDAVLEEFVEPKGLHRFRAVDRELVAEALWGYLNPLRVPGGEGEPTTLDASVAAAGQSPAALLEQLGEAHAVSEFLTRHGQGPPEQPVMTGVFSGPTGIYLTTITYGTGEPIKLQPVTAAELLTHIKEAVDQ
jgi:hypothetical protein